MERVFRADVGGKPIHAINLLAIGHELGERFSCTFFFFFVATVCGTVLPQLFTIWRSCWSHPEPSLKIALPFLNGLGRSIKNIGIDFVHVLLADIEQIVLRQLGRGHNEGHLVAEIFEVFPAQL